MKIQNSHQRGITWIEVMMIIVILIILSAIAIPRFVVFQNPEQQEPVKTTSVSATAPE